MKVGYVLRKFPVLSETFILNEILELEKLGMQVTIISLEKPAEARFHPDLGKLKAEINYAPNAFKKLWPYRKEAKNKFGKNYCKARNYLIRNFSRDLFFRFLQACYISLLFDKWGIEHIHAHFATRATSVAFFIGMLTGRPYSFTAHAYDIFKDTICKKALIKKIEHSKHVIAVSEFNKAYLSNLSPSYSHKVIKVLNGIDFDKFKPGAKASNSPFIFLCVARFVEKKGHRILLEACRILKEERKDFECHLVGKGELEDGLKTFILQNGLERQVKMLGALNHEEVLKQYHEAHAFVLTCIEAENGNKDGLPVSIVEALACGLPVITTPMTGNPEVVFPGVNGFLVPFNDPVSTAKAMNTLLIDKHHYERVKGAARQSILPLFNKEQTIRELASAFKKEIK